MPLTALDGSLRICILTTVLAEDALRKRARDGRLKCPDCSGVMHVKKSPRKRLFFAHNANGPPNCRYAEESEDHLALKEQIAHAVNAMRGWTAEIECGGNGWRADVLATLKKDPRYRVAFEVQLSHQDESETHNRTLKQAEDRVATVWLASSKCRKYKTTPALFHLITDNGKSVDYAVSVLNKLEKSFARWSAYRSTIDRRLKELNVRAGVESFGMFLAFIAVSAPSGKIFLAVDRSPAVEALSSDGRNYYYMKFDHGRSYANNTVEVESHELELLLSEQIAFTRWKGEVHRFVHWAPWLCDRCGCEMKIPTALRFSCDAYPYNQKDFICSITAAQGDLPFQSIAEKLVAMPNRLFHLDDTKSTFGVYQHNSRFRCGSCGAGLDDFYAIPAQDIISPEWSDTGQLHVEFRERAWMVTSGSYLPTKSWHPNENDFAWLNQVISIRDARRNAKQQAARANYFRGQVSVLMRRKENLLRELKNRLTRKVRSSVVNSEQSEVRLLEIDCDAIKRRVRYRLAKAHQNAVLSRKTYYANLIFRLKKGIAELRKIENEMHEKERKLRVDFDFESKKKGQRATLPGKVADRLRIDIRQAAELIEVQLRDLNLSAVEYLARWPDREEIAFRSLEEQLNSEPEYLE